MNKKKLALYAGVPAAIVAILMGMYFSGVRLLQTIAVMPYLENVAPNSRREFGLLEFVEHALIIAALIISVHAAIQARILILRSLFIFISAAILFLFLEEIDYGLHYYEFMAGVPPEQIATVRNLHNIGDRTSQMKHIADFAMGFAFVFALLPLRRAKSAWVRFFAPDPYLALTLILAVLTSRIAHTLDDQGLGVGIRSNISEFRELVTFYIGLMYTLELSRRARLEPPVATSAPAPPAQDREVPRDAG